MITQHKFDLINRVTPQGTRLVLGRREHHTLPKTWGPIWENQSIIPRAISIFRILEKKGKW